MVERCGLLCTSERGSTTSDCQDGLSGPSKILAHKSRVPRSASYLVILTSPLIRELETAEVDSLAMRIAEIGVRDAAPARAHRRGRAMLRQSMARIRGV
jgi:hypothetical protein